MNNEAIAIIGIGCRFPQADGVEAFWQLLRDGVDAIAPMPSDRRKLYPFSCIDDAGLESINANWGGFLNEVDQFDANFFGISANEAVAIDPQQRLLLEVSWAAIEDAALTLEQIAGTETGVFIGVAANGYEALLQAGRDQTAYTSMGASNAIAANRISQHFDLQGASIAVNTTCSSSLIAVDLACQNLWTGKSPLALAGGVNIFANLGISPQSAELLSSTHRCHSFSAAADGYVRSEGIGIVVLKPLSEALANGDRIYATIRGSAVNHNGRGNGLTAPNLQAQESLLHHAYQAAGINPDRVHYLEAHGTGTLMGDAVEMKAIERVFSSSIDSSLLDYRCQIGTVKTNIGHTETASGIAGLIKTALVLHHRQIPAHLHFDQPSPYIEFEKLSLQVPTVLTCLPPEGSLYAGVSAFGMGGTNAHVVLESAPLVSIPISISNENSSIKQDYHVLILSAKTEPSLRQMAIAYQQFLVENPEVAIAELCATAMRRSQFNYRLAIMANSLNELQQNLSEYISDRSSSQTSSQIFSGKANPKKYKKQSLTTILAAQALDPNIHQSQQHQILDLWVNGVKVDWSSLYANSHLKPISLPSYPFEHQSFWIQPLEQSRPSEPVSIIPNLLTTNQDRTELATNFVAPSDRTEKKLAKIWEKVFNIRQIGIHDNFFELGGTSIMAVNLFSKIDQAFSCRLSLVVLFQCPTIAQLAHMLSSKDQASVWSTLVPIRAIGIHLPLFCVSGIHGNVLVYADLAKHLGTSQPFYGLQSRGLDGIQPPHTSIEEMATYYIAAMKSVQPEGPYFLGGFSLGSKVVWEMAQQLHQQGQKVALLALFDGTPVITDIARQPFRKRIFLHYENLREKGFRYISQKSPAWKEWLIGRYYY
jgi:acyl transferase domain-containing protein